MGLANPAFPASAAFEQIQAGMSDDPKAKADAMKKANAVFAFTLKNKEGKTESWNIDLKKEGKVSNGVGEKPDGMLPHNHRFSLLHFPCEQATGAKLEKQVLNVGAH